MKLRSLTALTAVVLLALVASVALLLDAVGRREETRTAVVVDEEVLAETSPGGSLELPDLVSPERQALSEPGLFLVGRPRDSSHEWIPAERELPEEALWVEGRVVLPEGTPPEERVRVVVLAQSSHSGLQGPRVDVFEVDADGTFRAGFDPERLVQEYFGTTYGDPHRGALDLVSDWLYLEQPVDVDLEDPELQEIVLEPALAGRVRGRVRLPEGIEDERSAFEEIQVMLAGSYASGRSCWSRCRVDEEGRFEFSRLPASRTFSLWLLAEHLHAPSEDGLVITAGEELVVDLVAKRGVRIAGRVLDSAGEPMPGAWGSIECDPFDRQVPSRETRSELCTDEDGRFDRAGLVPGTFRLRMEAAGGRVLRRDLGALHDGQERLDLELALDPGLGFTGTVRLPNGTPAARATVLVLQSRDGGVSMVSYREHQAETDGDGCFAIHGLEAGPLIVHVHAAEEDPPVDETLSEPTRQMAPPSLLRDDLNAGDEEVELALDVGQTVHGAVVDDRGEPIQRFSLWVSGLSPSPSFPSRQHLDFTPRFEDTDGRFVLEGLDARPWMVRAKTEDGRDAGPIKFEVPTSQVIELIIPRRASLSGTVVTPDGSPAVGAGLLLGGNHGLSGALGCSLTTTDENGRFHLSGVKPGRFTLVAELKGWGKSSFQVVDLDPGELEVGLRCVLQRAGRIKGIVHPSVGEVAGKRVVFWHVGQGNSHGDTHTDDAGRFTFEDLAPGDYQLSLPDFPRDGSNAWDRPVDVTLTEAEEVWVELGAPPPDAVRLHGCVTIADQPVADVSVSAHGTTEFWEASTRSDAQGEFELQVKGSGRCELGFGHQGTRHVQVLDLQPGEDRRVDVELPVTSLGATVFGPDGGLACDAQVRVTCLGPLRSPNRRFSRRVRTDSSGRLRADALPAGTFALHVALVETGPEGSRTLGVCFVPELVLESGVVPDDLELRLDEPARVSLIIEDSSGAVALRPWLEIHLPGASERLSWPSTEHLENGLIELLDLPPGPLKLSAIQGRSRGQALVECVAGATHEVRIVVRE